MLTDVLLLRWDTKPGKRIRRTSSHPGPTRKTNYYAVARALAFAFAFDEPNCQADVYRDIRWRNLLGRTMLDFPGGRTGGNRYLVLGLGAGPATALAAAPDRDDLIVYGPLLRF